MREPVAKDTPETIYGRLGDLGPEERVLLCFPYSADPEEDWRGRLVSQGFLRIFENGAVHDLDGGGGGGQRGAAAGSVSPSPQSGKIPLPGRSIPGTAATPLLVIVDRLLWGKAARERILDSITTAYTAGAGRVTAVILPDRIRRFSSELSCADCQGASPIHAQARTFFPLTVRSGRARFAAASAERSAWTWTW